MFSSILKKTNSFAVHILSSKQAAHASHFSSPSTQSSFELVPHHIDPISKCPILDEVVGIIHCKLHSSQIFGDHEVYYGKVIQCQTDVGTLHGPLLYHDKNYRSIGDEVFLTKFEMATLGLEEWTHESHLRMAILYLMDYGWEEGLPRIW